MKRKLSEVKGVKNYWKVFLNYNKESRLYILIGLGLAICAQLCMLVIPFLTKFIIDDVIGAGNYHLFRVVFLISIGLLMLLFSTFLPSNYILFKTFVSNGMKLVTDTFRNLQFAPMKFFCVTPRGEITYRILTDTEVVSGSWMEILTIIPLNLLLLIGGTFMVLWHRDLALFVFLILILQSLVVIKFRKPLLRYSFLLKEKKQEVLGYTVDHFQKIELIRSLSIEKQEEKRFTDKLKEFVRISIKSFMFNQYAGTTSLIVNNFWSLGILWYGGTQVIKGEISLGTLMAFLLFSNILYQPVLSLTNLILSFQDIRASLARILEYLEMKPEPIEIKTAVEFTPTQGRISIENCSFSYNGRFVLKKINLEIPPRSIFALVGPSGAGKTSLCRLIVRFYDPQEGRILLDGKDIKEITLSSLRRSLLLILQTDYVFNTTLWGNITCGLKEVNKNQVLTAMKKAKIDFVDRLPQGYNTVLGVDGMKISSGEAQRIALARAFLFNPKVFILDEPTAFVDVETEEKIKEALIELKKYSTIILIAHRYSTVMIADKIAVMKNGEIIEVGNPQELLENENSVFKKMANFILTR